MLQVLRAFRANQGLLLAGAVAYYALLSIVPLLILTVIVLSHVVDQAELLQTLGRYLEWLVPGQSKAIVAELAGFMAHRDVLGWVLLGMSAGVIGGNTFSAGNAYSSAMFYVVAYVLTTLGTFGLILYLSSQGFESEEIADLSGLAQRSPWVAGVMTAFMFSLAGVPPLVGFYAKLAVLQALISTNQAAYVWLAVIAVLLSLVGAYYYLRLVKVMYFDAPTRDEGLSRGRGVSALLAVNGAAVLVFGLLPGGLMDLCRDAIVKALAS